MKPSWKRNSGKKDHIRNGDRQNHSAPIQQPTEQPSFSGSLQTISHVKVSKHFVAEFSPNTKQEIADNPPCVSTMDEEIWKDNAKQQIPTHTRKLWRKAAIWVTIACGILSLSLTIASFQSADNYDSFTALALAFDTANAVVCSSAVLWRLTLRGNDALVYKREKIACLIFAVSFSLFGALTVGLSIKGLVENTHPAKTFALIAVLGTGFFFYCVLGALQYFISKKLHSSAMLSSSLDSGTSAFLMVASLSSNVAYNFSQANLWYLDHFMAIIVSLFSITCGVQMFIQILIYKKLPMDILMT